MKDNNFIKKLILAAAAFIAQILICYDYNIYIA